MAATGRHRRYQPSRINRASLTVTAGGAGMALPLVGAGTAHAAAVDVWEKVAACESTNNWRINTGNGYYGGLQFSQSTWEAYGGRHYAPSADLASKDQQIAIAEKVLKGQGPQAWPVCSGKAGLTRGGDAPEIAPVRRLEPQSERKSEQRATPKKAAPKKSAPQKATPTTVPTHREGYTVAGGDSLSKIADSEQVTGGWQRLYAQNRTVVGADPDLIHPGQRLILRVEAPKPDPKPDPRPDPTGSAAPAKQKPKAQQKQRAPEQAPTPTPRPAPKQTPKQAPKAPKKQAPKQAGAAKPAHKSGLGAPVEASPGTAYGKAGSSWASGYHTGVDFPVATGTSVKAVASGRVVSAGWAGAYGYQVVIRHADGMYSQYAHLSALTVRSGQQVGSGQRIARSGSTGNTSGPHLHFEIRTGPGYGSDVDPLRYLRSGGVSV
ncbi:transglycosylase family protein [Streptomyces lunaelactis]|uniref:transglycosylase family protein n=1 Tax=Streptomyces lunaelactis TaxID=1535768 RepID=UPI001585B9A5|nr:transglycosylase family protein [Streptomyces lunaelactis]NUK50190.1 transglycosylase family protein [Streptomyces lunaelactis]NUK64550.1 transglycosylase family protein [Streptomyces lunaelactis]